MAISADTLSLQPLAAPIAPPPPAGPAIAAVGERAGASNERRNDSAKDGRPRTDATFRSFLNASTFVGLAQSVSRDTARTDTVEQFRQRAAKFPARDEAPVLSREESEQLYRDAHATADDRNPRAREFQAATSRYARSFFSVSGTYARPGDALELTA